MLLIPSGIQNIIFDLGGVIIHLDTGLTFEAMGRLGGLSRQEAEALAASEACFFQYERGEISPEQFFDSLRRLLKTETASEQLIEAWNAMLLHIPPQNLEVLRQLRKRYKLFMLSNTNTVHIEEVHRRLQLVSGEADFSAYFEQVYYSQDIGARKPEPAAFRTILDQWELRPEETLFIDDNAANLLGAQQLGIKTLLFPANGDLTALLEYGSEHT
ncbi:HAD family hydrolase [Cesiribacter andamanensis]|uniref:Phosphatase yihX n=1 Tax=Cesiribacter andamanensis AMV16 TaxID=1279009 RepID=M7N3J7_9BACT|nr:HAD family phosphatase [Cesiribacter andamanensis]EMR01867.1 Phosphatase yihX [Cesiribacter andamanensis AMV16]